MSDVPSISNVSHESDSVSNSEHQARPQSSENWSYEATIAQIEAIITRIELGELELEEVFEQFELAVSRLQECEAFLAHHRQRMDLLIETLTDDTEGF